MDIGIVRRRRGEFQVVLWVKEDGSMDIKLFCEESELFYQLVVDQRYIKNHHDMATFFASPKDLQYTLLELFDELDLSTQGTITLTLELQAAKINMTKVYVLKLQPSTEGELEYLRRKLSELKQESQQSLLNKDREIQSLIEDKLRLQQALSLCEEDVGRLQGKIQELNEVIKERYSEIQRHRHLSNSQRQAKIRLENVIQTSREHLQDQQLLLTTLQNQQQNASIILTKLSNSQCEANPHLYHFHYRYSPNGLTVTKKSQNGWSNFISGWAVHDTQVTRFELVHFKMRDGSLAVGVGSESVFLNGAIEHPEYVAYFCRDGRIYDSGIRRVNGRPIVSDDGMTVTVDRANATVTWHSNNLQIGRANLPSSTRSKRLYLIAKVFWKQDEFTLQC